MRHLLLLPCVLLAPDPRSELTTYIPMEISAPSGDKAANIKVYIPSRGQLSLATGDEVYESVLGSWTSVVEAHQAGLSEPGQPPGPGLSPGEAWHHYQAGQAGVVDSARLLITFSLVTSVQAGGEPLHVAASLGDVERVRRLLEAGARVDSVKDDGNTALHCAAIMGHNNVVELLVEEEADLEVSGNSGTTPLMMAASMGHLEVVKTLLKAGANPDTKHPFGKTTALHFAAEVGRDEIVRLLCDSGASVEAEKVTGGTALHTAVDANMSDTVAVLVEHCGAKVDKLLMGDTTPLYLAAQRGHTEVARQLLRLGARVNFVMPHGQHRGEVIQVTGERSEGFYPVKNTEVGNGATPLHAAVENGHLETTRLLLEAGAVQSDSMEGATPLIIALQYRHPAIAMLLLEEASGDPRINARVPVDGSSALFVASLYGYSEVVSRLLQRSIKINIKNKRGQTPLSAAISSNNLEVASMLLEAGATLSDEKTNQDLSPLQSAVLTKSLRIVKSIVRKHSDHIKEEVNSPGPDGQTALHLSLSGPLEIVKLLLDHGAEVDARVSSTLATPLHMAALRGRAEVVALLLSRDSLVQPRAGDSLHGATPLYLAAQTGDLETVRLLLEAGADANCVLRRMAVSPLFIASERGHTEVVRLLLRHGASVRLRNWNGVTSLGVAAMAGNIKIVRALIEAASEINSKDNDGNSVLLNFIKEGLSPSRGIDVLKQLLSAGADTNLKNKKGNYPLFELVSKKKGENEKGAQQYLKLLLQHGSKTETVVNTDNQVQTPLAASIEAKNILLSKALISENINLNIPISTSSSVLTPLGAAVRMKNKDLVSLILKHGQSHCIYTEADVTHDLRDCLEMAVASRDPNLIKMFSDISDAQKHLREEL